MRRHIFLLFGREKDNQRYYCFALIASRLEFRSGLMSALGQKQTFAAHKSMSALPPKADMCGALAHV
ncbi:MAG: hypothetical protein WCF75_02635, partial [Pseudolabrys sp.]